MSSLTRWVLAHKRIVVLFWIAMTVGGVLAAGPATRALTQEFSVPDKEGSVTNVEIAKRYGGTGGEAVPLLPVVALPAGKTVESPGHPRATSPRSTRRSSGRCPARASRPTPRPATAPSPRGTAAPCTRSSTRPGPTGLTSAATPTRRGTASEALAGATVGGAPVHVTGFDALEDESGGSEGPASSPRR